MNGASGNTISVEGPGCYWSTSSLNSWIHITSGAIGGPSGGTIAYTVDADSGAGRSGTISIGLAGFVVIQDGPTACTYSLSSQYVPSAGGTYDIGAGPQRAWTASTNASWITLNPGPGTGSGNLSFTVAPNAAALIRMGSIQINSQNFTVTQFGGTCSYVVSPSSINISATGGQSQISIETDNSCSWTVDNPASWVTPSLKNGLYLFGVGTLTCTVTANTASQARTATLIVAGQPIAINQAGLGIQFTSQSVVNGASFLSGPIAPGELIAIFGSGLGPSQGYGLEMTPDGHYLSTSLGGTHVLFDGMAAPAMALS